MLGQPQAVNMVNIKCLQLAGVSAWRAVGVFLHEVRG